MASRATVPDQIELARSTDEEKQGQLKRLHDFQARYAQQSPAMLQRLQQAVIHHHNVFAVLMDAVRCCSLGHHQRLVRGRRAVSAEHVGTTRTFDERRNQVLLEKLDQA